MPDLTQCTGSLSDGDDGRLKRSLRPRKGLPDGARVSQVAATPDTAALGL